MPSTASSSTAHLYRRQSANVMCAIRSARPFFSDIELTEIAQLSQAAHARRAAHGDPVRAPAPDSARPVQPVSGSSGTWHLVHLVHQAAQLASVRSESAANSTGPTCTIAGVVAIERTGSSPQVIAMRLVSRMYAG